MVNTIKNDVNLNIKFCDIIELKVNNRFLIIDLGGGEVTFHDNNECCYFCKDIEDSFLNYKGFLICKDCIKKIKDGEVGTVIY